MSITWRSQQLILAKPSPYRRFVGEAHHHKTHFVGQMDATVEAGFVGERGDTIGNIVNGPPAAVTYPSETLYEEPVENHTQANERDRKKPQSTAKGDVAKKHARKLRKLVFCAVINLRNIMNKKLKKRISPLSFYLCIGTEGRQIFKSEHPHFIIEKESLKELWRVMEIHSQKLKT